MRLQEAGADERKQTARRAHHHMGAHARVLRRHATYRPDAPAVAFGDTRLTHQEFNNRVNRLANALNGLGLGKGDKLAVVLDNSLELLDG